MSATKKANQSRPRRLRMEALAFAILGEALSAALWPLVCEIITPHSNRHFPHEQVPSVLVTRPPHPPQFGGLCSRFRGWRAIWRGVGAQIWFWVSCTAGDSGNLGNRHAEGGHAVGA